MELLKEIVEAFPFFKPPENEKGYENGRNNSHGIEHRIKIFDDCMQYRLFVVIKPQEKEIVELVVVFSEIIISDDADDCRNYSEKILANDPGLSDNCKLPEWRQNQQL